MRNVRFHPCSTVLCALALIVYAQPAPAQPPAPLTFVAIGDMPYRTMDFAPFETLLSSIDAATPDVTIHVGDIKGGGTPCDDDTILRQRDYMDGLSGAVVFTPGDNEWTDCHRKSAGRFDPLERLAFLRAQFFAAARSRGRAPRELERQSDSGPEFAQMVENARWSQSGVRFVTAHVVGSNNNLDRENPAAVAEYETRDAANVAWIRETFALAAPERAHAVVLAIHADLFLTMGIGGGFRNTLEAIGEGAKAFGGPVLVVHGDGHEYTIDTPFRDSLGNQLSNVFRLEVPGAADIRAVRVTIDPSAPTMFSFEVFGP